MAAWRTPDGSVLVEGTSRPRITAAWGRLGGPRSYFLLDDAQAIRERFEPHEGSYEDDLWFYSYRVERGELLERFLSKYVASGEPEAVQIDSHTVKVTGLEPIAGVEAAALEQRLRTLLQREG